MRNMTWDKKIPCLPEQKDLQMQSAIWVIDVPCCAQTSPSKVWEKKIAAEEKLRSLNCKGYSHRTQHSPEGTNKNTEQHLMFPRLLRAAQLPRPGIRSR